MAKQSKKGMPKLPSIKKSAGAFLSSDEDKITQKRLATTAANAAAKATAAAAKANAAMAAHNGAQLPAPVQATVVVHGTPTIKAEP